MKSLIFPNWVWCFFVIPYWVCITIRLHPLLWLWISEKSTSQPIFACLLCRVSICWCMNVRIALELFFLSVFSIVFTLLAAFLFKITWIKQLYRSLFSILNRLFTYKRIGERGRGWKRTKDWFLWLRRNSGFLLANWDLLLIWVSAASTICAASWLISGGELLNPLFYSLPTSFIWN